MQPLDFLLFPVIFRPVLGQASLQYLAAWLKESSWDTLDVSFLGVTSLSLSCSHAASFLSLFLRSRSWCLQVQTLLKGNQRTFSSYMGGSLTHPPGESSELWWSKKCQLAVLPLGIQRCDDKTGQSHLSSSYFRPYALGWPILGSDL